MKKTLTLIPIGFLIGLCGQLLMPDGDTLHELGAGILSMFSGMVIWNAVGE